MCLISLGLSNVHVLPGIGSKLTITLYWVSSYATWTDGWAVKVSGS